MIYLLALAALAALHYATRPRRYQPRPQDRTEYQGERAGRARAADRRYSQEGR